jgi:phage tail-like protein
MEVHECGVLKRGIVSGDKECFQWVNTARLNVVERRDVVSSLLNEAHEPVASWRVRNAFPCKYIGPELRANSSEVAFESLELAHEGLTLLD